jgi:hypothetical protein
MDYALFFAAVWGLSAGIAFSKLTAPFHEWLAKRSGASARWLAALLGCPMCLATHFGWSAVLFGIAPGPHTVLHAATLAFACAGITLVLALVAERLAP